MIDLNDQTFAEQLEQALRKVLTGDDKTPGLYRTVLSSPNWDHFNRTAGAIQAYENVLQEMRRIARRINEEPMRKEDAPRAMN